MDEIDHQTSQILEELQKPENPAIIRLSEPFSAEDHANNAKRESDISADARENTSVVNLEAELAHYKDLFSKLRFSYVEQVTKEKFLRAIASDPPLLVEPHENSELEAQLQEVKAELKTEKEGVAQLTQELETRGRELAQRHERIRLHTAELASLPTTLADLYNAVAHLRTTTSSLSTNPSLNLPLSATLTLKAQKEAQLETLNTQLAQLQAGIPHQSHELERLQKDLEQLDAQKQGTVAAATEARRRREGWGGRDELEDRGRWARACEGALRGMLEVEG
ncbi:MAG: hypothetical protein M1822_000946 [Bathelium mastoideum]|nr:MAG: hypothetical protein M1822_000946 [Bathelium mastoideum]